MNNILNIGQVVAKIWNIETKTNVKCISYGLYDKTNKEYINASNKSASFDYTEAYDNRNIFRYTYDKNLDKDFIIYLFQHHGEIYFPMLKKNDQKAYVAQFDLATLLEKYGESNGVTPAEYFSNIFCKKKKASKQCEGQLELDLI